MKNTQNIRAKFRVNRPIVVLVLPVAPQHYGRKQRNREHQKKPL